MKKITALILSTVMAVSLINTMNILPGRLMVYADVDSQPVGTNTDKAPSVSAYADKTALSDNTFKPDAWGDSYTEGKLKFGKNESGDAQEWYIFGADPGVNDGKDNLVIFAASPMKKNVMFIDPDKIPTEWTAANYLHWQSKDDGDYTGSAYDMPVNGRLWWWHYGVSGIRKELQKMAKDTKYFDTTEQAMLQATTITTNDYYSNNSGESETKADGSENRKWKTSTYTTTDKLYLASSNGHTVAVQTIFIGSGGYPNFGVINFMGNTYSENINENYKGIFWLRSASQERYDDKDSVPVAYIDLSDTRKHFRMSLGKVDQSNYTDYWDVNHALCIRPASNINIKNVSFASAAEAASSGTAEGGVIPYGTAMTLRLDGTGMDLGSVLYCWGGITVKRGSTASKVSLVAQGNDGNDDWYFSKLITETTEKVSLKEIAATAGIDADNIDLTSSNCRIWLETPHETSESLAYAVNNTALHSHTYDTGYEYDADSHWQQCTDTDCPDPEKGKHESSIAHSSGSDFGSDDDNHWKICGVCEAKYNVSSHDPSTDYSNDDDNHWKICIDCGKKLNVTGHSFGSSHGSDGTKHWKVCDTCGYIKDEGVHDYGDDDTWYHDEKNHYKKCIVCESDKSIKADTKEAHTYGTDGKCTTCGYDINSKHPLELVDEVEPTCTKVGYKSYYRCKDEGCDVKYRSALGILIRFTDMSEIELPKAEHVEGDSYSHDSSSHWLTCVNCGEPLKKASHKLSTDYSSDDTNHWKTCTICEAELEVTAHEPGTDYIYDSDSHWKQCEVCGEKLGTTEHNLKDGFFTDGNNHWRECKTCDAKLEIAEHEPSADYIYDSTSHWKVCVTCGEKLGATAHNPSSDYSHDEDTHWKTCTDCGEKLSEASHKSDIWQYDADKHWRVCSDCGMIYDTAAHEIKLGTCTSCGYKSPKTTRNRSSESLPVNTNNVTHGVWERDSRGWRYKLLNGSYAGYSNSAADGSTAKIGYAGDTINATANSAASAASNPTGQTAGTDKERISWFKINNADYAFAADGYFRTGWVYDVASGRWYYCDENKGKLNGWFFDTADGYWYYLDPRTGEMLSGWQLINGREYYLAPAPQESTYTYDSTQNKWVYNNAKAYRPFGSLYVNTVTPDGYYVDAEGAKME